ncbi:MAG: AtpZ/AtpI family protein [Candidatus Saccharimonadales bacterium]
MSRQKSPGKMGNKQFKDGDDVDGQRMVFMLIDTTWRVALPILVLSLLGHYIDKRTGHVILFSLTGFFLSLVIATLLVYRQLCVVFPNQFGKYKLQDKKDTN